MQAATWRARNALRPECGRDQGQVPLLAYKAESAGTRIVIVNPACTSQACSECGAIVPKDLRICVHVCPDCGLTLERDVNAARNILMLAVNTARTGPPGRNVAGSGERALGSSLL
ncbi:MAG: zinc ribbon domain-containing protein [Mesotoga sp.]|nr:transposase [Thermotogota bacterium]